LRDLVPDEPSALVDLRGPAGDAALAVEEWQRGRHQRRRAYLSMAVGVDTCTSVDVARTHAGPASYEPEGNKTWNDQFAKHSE